MKFHIVTCIFHLLRVYYELNAKNVLLGIYGTQIHPNDQNTLYLSHIRSVTYYLKISGQQKRPLIVSLQIWIWQSSVK